MYVGRCSSLSIARCLLFVVCYVLFVVWRWMSIVVCRLMFFGCSLLVVCQLLFGVCRSFLSFFVNFIVSSVVRFRLSVFMFAFRVLCLVLLLFVVGCVSWSVSLLVVVCLLCVVRCSLFVVCCLWFVVLRVLFCVCCLLFVDVSCSLCVARCALFVVCCWLLFDVRGVLPCFFLFLVCCVCFFLFFLFVSLFCFAWFVVDCVLFVVGCLLLFLFSDSCFLCAVCDRCLMYVGCIFW